MLYDMVQERQDPEVEQNERLRMELGWGEVAKGLTQVLVGYGVLFLGMVIGIGLVVISMFGLRDALMKGGRPHNGDLWQFYIGLGIISVIGLISFGIVVGGQFKCMMYASERQGARWFMFMCMACLLLGPAFHAAAGIASRQALAEIKNNPAKMRDLQFGPFAHRMQMTGFVISMVYPLCFILFLRAIAACLRSPIHVMVVNIFLVFAAVLVAATGYVLYNHPPGSMVLPPVEALALGGGWLVLGVLYIMLIVLTRICITTVMARVKSPLEM
jgi:hypothetical protein